MPRWTPRCGPGAPVAAERLAPHRLALPVRRGRACRPTSAAAISPGACGRHTQWSVSSTAAISRSSAWTSTRRALSTSGSSGTGPSWPGGGTAARRRRVHLRCGRGSGCARPSCAGGAGSTPAGAELVPRRPPRQDRPARLLDVLLRQLPARARRAQGAGGALRRRAGDDRRALAEVRARGGPRRRRGRGGALRRSPPRARRPGAAHVGRLRGAGVADARGDRPAGLRGRADVRARATRTGSPC